jgi:hypothetical protein
MSSLNFDLNVFLAPLQNTMNDTININHLFNFYEDVNIMGNLERLLLNTQRSIEENNTNENINSFCISEESVPQWNFSTTNIEHLPEETVPNFMYSGGSVGSLMFNGELSNTQSLPEEQVHSSMSQYYYPQRNNLNICNITADAA